MRAEKLSVVKNQLSRFVDQVRRGERIRILLRGVPVADLVPINESSVRDGELGRRLADLERRGIVVPGRATVDEALFEPGPRPKGRPLSELLIEHRRTTR